MIDQEQPDICPIPNPNGDASNFLYQLRGDYQSIFTLGECNCKNDYKITIPDGFIYDGTSGRPYTSLAGIYPDGLERKASLVHDYLYAHKGQVPILKLNENGIWVDSNRIIARAEADQIFYKILCSTEGIPSDRAKLMFDIVDFLGGIWWDAYGKPSSEQRQYANRKMTFNA